MVAGIRQQNAGGCGHQTSLCGASLCCGKTVRDSGLGFRDSWHLRTREDRRALPPAAAAHVAHHKVKFEIIYFYKKVSCQTTR